MVDAGEFAWHQEFASNHYGTRSRYLFEARERQNPSGMILLPERVVSLRETLGEGADLKHLYIKTPPTPILSGRMRERGDDTPTTVKRLETCRHYDRNIKASGVPYHWITNEGTPEEMVRQVLDYLEE